MSTIHAPRPEDDPYILDDGRELWFRDGEWHVGWTEGTSHRFSATVPYDEVERLLAETSEDVELDGPRPLLDAFDIAAINAARTVLVELAERCEKLEFPDEREYMLAMRLRNAGHLEGRCEDAEHALFQLFNFAKHHLGVAINDAQMFNKP